MMIVSMRKVESKRNIDTTKPSNSLGKVESKRMVKYKSKKSYWKYYLIIIIISIMEIIGLVLLKVILI